MTTTREIQTQEAEAYAKSELGVEYLETSAKEGINVNEAFLRLAEQMKKRKDGMASSGLARPQGATLLLSDEPPPRKPSKRGCIV